jgi:solute carrier family 27 fatty acid transporter 1/4
MENRPEYVAIWLGLAKVGLVPALINYNLKLQALVHTIKVANAKAIIYGAELQDSKN